VKTLHAFPPSSDELANFWPLSLNTSPATRSGCDYPKFRADHLFIGSGVIEAGCKTVIGSRLKKSGMFWTVRGANSIIALRCNRLSDKFQDYWESRRAA